MKIVRIYARLFEHALPTIRKYEEKGMRFLRDEDDGLGGVPGVACYCCKRLYFDDGNPILDFEDLTKPT